MVVLCGCGCTLQDAIYEDRKSRNGQIMTLDGAVQKTSILLGVAVLTASYTWMQARKLIAQASGQAPFGSLHHLGSFVVKDLHMCNLYIDDRS